MDKWKEWGIDLTESQIEKFNTYYHILSEWNSRMNLTTIEGEDEVWRKHFLDSLSIVKTNLPIEDKKVIDVGSGAGFPGLPIKIYWDSVQLTLLEAREKKANFLQETVDACKLTNVETIHARAEDYGVLEDYRETYDVCVARAVAKLPTLCEYCLPFVRVGGWFVAYKAKKAEEELATYKRSIQHLGGQLEEVISFTLPETDEQRKLIMIKKVKKTPLEYPRKAGTPERQPVT